MTTLDQQASKTLTAWRDDPYGFVCDQFDVTPDPWQAEVLRAFPHKQRIALKACKGPGKTALMAWLAWHFLATQPFPKIAATSITADNLADNLWAEMAKWQLRSRYLGGSPDRLSGRSAAIRAEATSDELEPRAVSVLPKRTASMAMLPNAFGSAGSS